MVRGFVYDAFGRLVKSTGLPGEEEPVLVSRYRYNGLGFRIMRQDDVDADTTLEADERFFMAYDERWRVVGTFRDEDDDPKEAFVYHAAGQGGNGGSSYIDSVILRDRDNYTGGTPNGMTSASDGVLEERRYYVQNWRADVVAVTKSDGVPLEYVRYSAYGEPTVHPVADLNLDGVVDSADADIWEDLDLEWSDDYAYTRDIDFDGYHTSYGDDSELFQESYSANVGLSGKGRLSSAGVGNTIGYAGYQWDQTLRANHVRHRVYLPEIGRWTRRDPLGYVDQNGLLQYVASRVMRLVDPSGLKGRGTCHRGDDSADGETATTPDPSDTCGVRLFDQPVFGGNDGSSLDYLPHRWIEMPNDAGGVDACGFYGGGGPGNGWNSPATGTEDPAVNSTKVESCVARANSVINLTGTLGDLFAREREQKLMFGAGATTRCADATCDQIRSCINNYRPSFGWHTGIGNNCLRHAVMALESCCLGRCEEISKGVRTRVTPSSPMPRF